MRVACAAGWKHPDGVRSGPRSLRSAFGIGSVAGAIAHVAANKPAQPSMRWDGRLFSRRLQTTKIDVGPRCTLAGAYYSTLALPTPLVPVRKVPCSISVATTDENSVLIATLFAPEQVRPTRACRAPPSSFCRVTVQNLAPCGLVDR